MVRGDHLVFALRLPQHVVQGEVRHLQRIAPAVAPGQEQKLLHQSAHVFALALDGGNAFLQHLRVVLAPAVQHVGITLDHGDRRAQLVGGVGDEPRLPREGLAHALQQTVDRRLQPLQLTVAGVQRAVLGVHGLDGVLQLAQDLVVLLFAADGARRLGQPRQRPHDAVEGRRAEQQTEDEIRLLKEEQRRQQPEPAQGSGGVHQTDRE